MASASVRALSSSSGAPDGDVASASRAALNWVGGRVTGRVRVEFRVRVRVRVRASVGVRVIV